MNRYLCLIPLCVFFVSVGVRAEATEKLSWTTEKIVDSAGRVDWYHGDQHQLIAYDAISDFKKMNTELFTIQPDGSQKRCVTCESSIPKGFVGQPAWHPDGEHILIQVENSHSMHRRLNHLSFGIDNDLWLIRKDGSEAERIWKTPKRHAALHPHFNKDGTQLMFSERISTGKSYPLLKRLIPEAEGENHWDGWRIHIADFDMKKKGQEKLSNHRTLFADRNGFFETHGFTGDGKIVFSHTPGGRPYVDDIYMSNPNGSNLKKLIDSPATWDEHGSFSPVSRALAFISSRADSEWQAPKSKAKSLKTELFLKTENGDIMQLTAFNQKEDSKKRYLVSDFDWDKTGKRIVFQVAPVSGRRGKPDPPQLWMLTFSKSP
jgi:hypothetical protein